MGAGGFDIHRAISDTSEALAEERRVFEAEKERMRGVYEFQKQKVKLDVGGHRFSTSRATLLGVPGSFLAAMFSGDHPLEKDEDDGSYFVDRDGRHFHHILNYLVRVGLGW